MGTVKDALPAGSGGVQGDGRQADCNKRVRWSSHRHDLDNGGKKRPGANVAVDRVPFDGDVALVGTNFGGATTPGWVYNLEANPDGVAKYGDVEVPFAARFATADESEEPMWKC